MLQDIILNAIPDQSPTLGRNVDMGEDGRVKIVATNNYNTPIGIGSFVGISPNLRTLQYIYSPARPGKFSSRAPYSGPLAASSIDVWSRSYRKYFHQATDEYYDITKVSVSRGSPNLDMQYLYGTVEELIEPGFCR